MFGLSVHLSFHLFVRPSVRPTAGVVTLTMSFSIGFLPNNIYGLLASTSNSNMDFFRQMTIMMVGKMAAVYQFASIVVTHIWFASIK